MPPRSVWPKRRLPKRLSTCVKSEGEKRSREGLAAPKFGDRSIMNTSFTMDLGETVVVGTSRLSGNSKALIALLTAVPPKSAR